MNAIVDVVIDDRINEISLLDHDFAQQILDDNLVENARRLNLFLIAQVSTLDEEHRSSLRRPSKNNHIDFLDENTTIWY